MGAPPFPYRLPFRNVLFLQLAKEYGMDFYETSACTNLNIKEVSALL